MKFFWWPVLTAFAAAHLLYMSVEMLLGGEPSYGQLIFIRFGADKPSLAFGYSAFWALVTLILIGVGIARIVKNRFEEENSAETASEATETPETSEAS